MRISALKIHPFGVAVASISATKSAFEKAGYVLGETIFDPLQDVKICFAEKPEEIPLELLEPASAASPITGTLQKSGGEPQICHVCYAVSDLENAILSLRKSAWILVKKPLPAVALGNAKVAFLYSKDAGLIELLESSGT